MLKILISLCSSDFDIFARGLPATAFRRCEPCGIDEKGYDIPKGKFIWQYKNEKRVAKFIFLPLNQEKS